MYHEYFQLTESSQSLPVSGHTIIGGELQDVQVLQSCVSSKDEVGTCLVLSVYISQRSVCQLYATKRCPIPFMVHMVIWHWSVWSVVLGVEAVSVLVYCLECSQLYVAPSASVHCRGW